MKIGGSLARNARFGAPTCLVSRVWFSCGLAVSMGEAAKLVLLSCCKMSKLEEVSYEMLVLVLPRVYGGSWKTSPIRISPSRLSCPFAWQAMALCDIPTCLITCRKYQIGGSLARNARSFAPTCLVSSLWFSCGVAVSMGEAPHSTLYTLHSTIYTLDSTLYTPHFTLCTLHSSVLT